MYRMFDKDPPEFLHHFVVVFRIKPLLDCNRCTLPEATIHDGVPTASDLILHLQILIGYVQARTACPSITIWADMVMNWATCARY